jgi:GxxExxY protein
VPLKKLSMDELLHKDLTNKIINCFFTVYNTLGFGFLEKVYENSLLIELRKQGIKAERQKPIRVYYTEQLVGEYFADIIVSDSVIVELKAAEFLIEEHELQLINYLKGTDKEIGLLLNFGKKPEFRRKIFTNDRKRIDQGNINVMDDHK